MVGRSRYPVTALIRRRPVGCGLCLVLLVLLGVWSVKLVQVKRSVDRAAAFWAEPRGEPGGLLYVALGDSAAQGVGASRPERGYVGLVADRLRAASGRPVQVVNLSSSGARIDDVLREQVPRLQELDADLVTVAVGGNDLRSFDAATYAAQVDALTAALPAGAVLADAPYFMHGRWERDAQRAARRTTLSAEQQGLHVAPLREVLEDRGWSAMLTDFSADWFHPNDQGHQVWAQAFWSVISRPPLADRLGLPAG